MLIESIVVCVIDIEMNVHSTDLITHCKYVSCLWCLGFVTTKKVLTMKSLNLYVLLGTAVSYSDKPPVFGPCKLLDFELEMVIKQLAVFIFKIIFSVGGLFSSRHFLLALVTVWANPFLWQQLMSIFLEWC